MDQNSKIWESQYLIRFPDCDPFNHLNNSRYFDYFINAREDQLLKYQGFDIYDHARKSGQSWVVSSHRIAYLKPAMLMEKIIIQTSILKMDEKSILVEMAMFNQDKSVLKAFLWTNFVCFNLQTQKAQVHDPEMMKVFLPLQLLDKESSFNDRLEELKRSL